jgi:tetratricopeptide (TPR) repeat protein
MSCCHVNRTEAERDYALGESIANRAFFLADEGNLELAQKLLETTLALISFHADEELNSTSVSAEVMPKHNGSRMYFTSLGVLYLRHEKPDLAIKAFRQALDCTLAMYDDKHELTAFSMHNLAEGYHVAGDSAQAYEIYTRIFPLLEPPRTHEDDGVTQEYVDEAMFDILSVYAKVLRTLGKDEEALAVDERIKNLQAPAVVEPSSVTAEVVLPAETPTPSTTSAPDANAS